MAHILRGYLGASQDTDDGGTMPDSEGLEGTSGPDPVVPDPPVDLGPSMQETMVGQRLAEPNLVEPFYLDPVDEQAEVGGPDPLLIALLLIAVVAIIGLVPLWWAVYNAWSLP
jgi:hypothetical protein